MHPLVIDVEASGFGPGSYPIEVGVAMPDGKVRCMIIRPIPEWQHWDEQAESLHGISREILLEFGSPVREVAEQLNQWLEGEMVYSDAWGNDSSWLALLFDAAGIRQAFKLDSLFTLLSKKQINAIFNNGEISLEKKLSDGQKDFSPVNQFIIRQKASE